MRPAGLALAVLWAAAPAAVAQVPPADRVPVPGADDPRPAAVPVARPAARPAADPAVKAHLDNWQRVMAATTNFFADCTKTNRHLVINKESVYAGRIYCLKPSLARVRIDKKPAAGERPDPAASMEWICNGKAVYEYDAAARQLTEYPLAGGAGDNILLAFMSGALTAADVTDRFDLKLLKEDEHYVYLEARPRLDRDRAEFEAVTLVLFRPPADRDDPRLRIAYLPAQVVLVKANGQVQEVWDFPRPVTNAANIRPEHFEPQRPPADWRVVRAQPAAAPRAPRPGAPD